jgi:hypothetical protein
MLCTVSPQISDSVSWLLRNCQDKAAKQCCVSTPTEETGMSGSVTPAVCAANKLQGKWKMGQRPGCLWMRNFLEKGKRYEDKFITELSQENRARFKNFLRTSTPDFKLLVQLTSPRMNYRKYPKPV